MQKKNRRKSKLIDSKKNNPVSSIPEKVSTMESIMSSTIRTQEERILRQKVVDSIPTVKSKRIASPEAVIAALDSNKEEVHVEMFAEKDEAKAFSLLCLQSTVKLGRVAPGDTVRVTLHFLPLKRGIVQMDSLKLVDSISGQHFGLQKPFTISIIGDDLEEFDELP